MIPAARGNYIGRVIHLRHPSARGALLGAAVALVASRAGAQLPEQAVYTITVHVTPTPAAVFVPSVAFGAALDGLQAGEVDRVYTPSNVAAMRSAGLVPITYRLRTELGVEAWHWNPSGRWSDAAHAQGYWTSDTLARRPILVSNGYRLPRRGNSGDQANDDGYSRLDDGDARTFWKSNPYIDPRYTGEPADRHPHWLVIDLRVVRPVNAVRIRWADPYATRFVVQRWVPADSEGARQPREHPDDEHIPSGRWEPFEHGAVEAGRGGDQIVRVTDAPVDTRLIRILMTATSHTALPGSRDVRDSLGVAVREVYAGTIGSDGVLHDVIRHGRPMSRQTIMYVSSTDPWHRAVDRDPNVEQPGFDRVYRSGLTHGRPMLIPVGVLYDTPENAAAELRFLRARRYPVAGVEMGEEPDGQAVEPEDYGALYLAFASVLHRADSTVALGAAGFQDMISYPSPWPDVTVDRSWMRRFLNVLRARKRMNDFGFFSFERYPYDNLCGDVLPQLTTVTTQFAAAIDTLRADGVPTGVPWLMTEYGYSAFGGQPEVEMSGALLNADLVGQFLLAGGRTAYLYGYEPTSLLRNEHCDSWGNNMLLVADDEGRAKMPVAAYYGARLLSRVWARPGDGEHALYRVTTDVPTLAGGPSVSAYAARRPDGRLSLLVLNKDPVRAIRVRVVLHQSSGDAPLRAPVELFQYSGAQYRWHPRGERGFASPDLPPARSVIPGPGDAVVTLPPSSMTVVRSATR